MSDTITKRTVAQDARAFGRSANLDYAACGPTARGRVPADLVLQYLQTKPAKTVREIAEGLGVEVSDSGKISEAEFIALVDNVTKNSPKVEAGE
jgi:hypothetical protein